MKFWLDSWGVDFGQASRLDTSTPHSGEVSAPAGGGETATSPPFGVWRGEDDDVPRLRFVQVVDEAVDEDALADVERRFHRARGDLVRLHHPGLQRPRQRPGPRDDPHELDQPAP